MNIGKKATATAAFYKKYFGSFSLLMFFGERKQSKKLLIKCYKT